MPPLVPHLDTVQLDSAHGPEFTGAEAQLTKYRVHLDWMDDAALPSAASRDLIRNVARVTVRMPAVPVITWEDPYCGEGNNCFRIGTDSEGNAYIAVAGQEDHYLTDTREALRTLIKGIKAGKADHLL